MSVQQGRQHSIRLQSYCMDRSRSILQVAVDSTCPAGAQEGRSTHMVAVDLAGLATVHREVPDSNLEVAYNLLTDIEQKGMSGNRGQPRPAHSADNMAPHRGGLQGVLEALSLEEVQQAAGISGCRPF